MGLQAGADRLSGSNQDRLLPTHPPADACPRRGVGAHPHIRGLLGGWEEPKPQPSKGDGANCIPLDPKVKGPPPHPLWALLVSRAPFPPGTLGCI